MVRLSCLIKINDYLFDYVHTLEIISTWDNFTDTATIKLPQKLEFNGKPIINGADSLFKRGDSVEIWLGYDDTLVKEFEGFISDLNPGTPFTIHCEDLMYKLKQKTFTISYKEATLKQVLSDITGGVPFEALDVNLGKFRATRANAVEIFDEIKKTYGLVTWAQGGKIYSGLAYVPALQEQRKLDLNYDVVNSGNLVFKRADDVEIKIKAISLNKDNTKTEIEEPQGGDGQTRTFTYYDLTESDLRATAKRELEKLKFDGYRGDLTAFGTPYIKHGDTIKISDPKIPEREGEYLVKQVNTSFGVNGFRRQTYLDRKV